MNAQLRLDIARELLRLASPARRGLRKMVLNTKTGRRTYWVQIPKPKAIEKRQRKTAKQLGLSIEDLSFPKGFHLKGNTKQGTPVLAICQDNGEISFQVAESFNAGVTTGADAIGAAKLMKRLMKEGMASHPKGTLYSCTPFDNDEEKQESKKKFYQANGFGKEIDGNLFAIKGDNDLHPVDRSYIKEIKDKVEQAVDDYENDREETERIAAELEEERESLENDFDTFSWELERLRSEADKEEDDDAREEMEDEIDELDNLISDRRDQISRNEDRMNKLWEESLSISDNILRLHEFFNY